MADLTYIGKIGDVVMFQKFGRPFRVRLTEPARKRPSGRWEAPGHRWLDSEQKWSGNPTYFLCDAEPVLVAQ